MKFIFSHSSFGGQDGWNKVEV